MPHELVHQHEGGLHGSTKPADQLIANIAEPGDGLKAIPDAFLEICLCTVCVIGALLCNDICPFCQTYILKTLTHQVKQCWTIVLLSIFDLKSGSVNGRKYSGLNHAWSGAMCRVISLVPFSKESLIQSGCFRPSSMRFSGMPSAPKDVQQVYQLNWGVFCSLIRSDIIRILACLDLSHACNLVAYLLDCAGISPQQKTKRIGCWDVLKRQYKEVEYVAMKIIKLSI